MGSSREQAPPPTPEETLTKLLEQAGGVTIMKMDAGGYVIVWAGRPRERIAMGSTVALMLESAAARA